MSNVLNGFPESEIASTNPTAFDNFIGSSPKCLAIPESLPTTAPKCLNCGEPTTFILQFYCPVDEDNRVLYFFACLRKDCQKSGNCWRVYKLSTQSQAPKICSPPLVSDWGFGEDADDSDNDNAGAVIFRGDNAEPDVLKQSVSSASVNEQSHSLESLKSPFECHFVRVYDEETDCPEAESNSSCLRSWILDYRAEAEFIEEDEKDANQVDKVTPHYALHLASRDPAYGCEPIRYSWCGQPIFTTEAPSEDWAPYLRCARCGRRRVFELQLFGSLNNHLQKAKDVGEVDFDPIWPLNISTLIVFSCQANCGFDELVEECTLLQTEQGESFFSGSGN